MKAKFIFILCYIISYQVFFFHTLEAQEYMPKIHVFDTPEEMGFTCAREIADLIRLNQKLNKKTVLGLATGSTPLPLYKALKNILLTEKIDLSHVITFNLDEYVDLPEDHPQSYHSFMQRMFFADLMQSQDNPLGFHPKNIHIPNGYAQHLKDLSKNEIKALGDAFPKRKKNMLLTEIEKKWILEKRAEEYEALILEKGPIDIQILGIGTNGHIGFAEPGSSFSQTTSLVTLTESTRKDNARFFENDLDLVPHHALTMGVKTILGANRIFLLATGEKKAHIIQNILSDVITTHLPATALRTHSHVEVFLDEASSSKIGDNKIFRFFNGRILRDHELKEGDLWVRNGKIISSQGKADVEIDVKGHIIAPGYIDLQLNGGFGIDFTTEPDRVAEVAKNLPRYGVTSFLATIVSSEKEKYQNILSFLQPKKIESGAELLGLHLEGPFCNPSKRGAHDFKCIRCWENDFDFYGDLEGVKLVTLAPEIVGGFKLIEWLNKKHIVVSIGHSNANFEQAKHAIDLGVHFATHLFNAMTPFQHRDPGIIGAVLNDPQMFYSIITDGHHLHPKTIELAWRTNPNGLVLVSDAIEALGFPSGNYRLGNVEVTVKDDIALVKGTQTIAGSVTSLDKAVRTLREWTGCSIVQALEAASFKPAHILGIEDKKGNLNVGADADLIILNENLEVINCYVSGKIVWQN